MVTSFPRVQGQLVWAKSLLRSRTAPAVAGDSEPLPIGARPPDPDGASVAPAAPLPRGVVRKGPLWAERQPARMPPWLAEPRREPVVLSARPRTPSSFVLIFVAGVAVGLIGVRAGHPTSAAARTQGAMMTRSPVTLTAPVPAPVPAAVALTTDAVEPETARSPAPQVGESDVIEFADDSPPVSPKSPVARTPRETDGPARRPAAVRAPPVTPASPAPELRPEVLFAGRL